ncbi:hypothetical protein FQN54_002426 [Arachnomyces sp. PD_36]|nr:hypothetical protein FQN54_002426 [Arachnomyces sp. PD_36]
MSAVTTARPSPQSPWSPSMTRGCVGTSTTPAGIPARTPVSVGQIATPSFFPPPGCSPRMMQPPRAPSPNYFGLVVDTPTALTEPNTNWPESHAPTSARSTGPLYQPFDTTPEFETLRQQSELLRYHASHHRNTSSFDRQTQARRDLGRQREESRGRQSPVSPHTILPPSELPPQSNGGDRMDIDQTKPQFPEKQSDTPVAGSPLARPQRESPPPFQLSMSSSRFLRTPQVTEESRDARLSLPTHVSTPLPRQPSSLSVSGFRAPQRAETLPAAVDPDGITTVSAQRCFEFLKSSPHETLLLDIRPFPQFSASRIKGSLNLCIPTTLLKRPSFNLRKLEETFTSAPEKELFCRWKSSSRIIVSDAATTQMKDATPLINVLKKFICEGWKGEPLILRGGFSEYSRVFPDEVEYPSKQQQPASTNSKQPLSIDLSLPSVAPVVGGCAMPTVSSTNPFFGNIRQNMDLIGGVGQFSVTLPPNMTDSTRAGLPRWLLKACDARDNGKEISDKFLAIEKGEQHRMQEALSGKVTYSSPGPNAPNKPIRIAGIEKGAKNRYNNIYPYDHTRVRLHSVVAGSCDYVNASHIKASRSNKRYIATQAPMPSTFNDFWRVVWEQDARVIVMLTAESEGGQLKCHPYWKAGDYGTFQLKLLAERQVPLETRGAPSPQTDRPGAGQRRLTNPHTESEKKNVSQPPNASASEPPYIRIRHFSLSDTSSPFQPIREVTQLQYAHWPDFGTPAHPTHILQLLDQCDRATVAISSPGSTFEPEIPVPEKQRPIVVHCSAGCGRTGTFCTVDSVIDMLKRQRSGQSLSAISGLDLSWLRNPDIDLIAKTVEDFRLQRLSMVQSLRQFVLCYESILEWIVSLSPPSSVPTSTALPSSSSSSRLDSLKREGARRSFHG